MTTKVLLLILSTLVLMLTEGCGQMSEKSFESLEQQRSDVIEWSRELSSTANSVLESRAEDSTGAYDGVDTHGWSDKYKSYHYDIQASFRTAHADPIAALAAAFEEYEPTVKPNGSLHLVRGDLTAAFWAPPAAEGTVGFTANGPAVEVDQEEMSDWDGEITNEPVDLD